MRHAEFFRQHCAELTGSAQAATQLHSVDVDATVSEKAVKPGAWQSERTRVPFSAQPGSRRKTRPGGGDELRHRHVVEHR